MTSKIALSPMLAAELAFLALDVHFSGQGVSASSMVESVGRPDSASFCRAVVGFDVDAVALEQARLNALAAGLEQGEFDTMLCDVLAPSGLPISRSTSGTSPDGTPNACGPFDVAVMNPCGTDTHRGAMKALHRPSYPSCRPFGTRRPGADVGFVVAGLGVVHSAGVVYRFA